MTTTYYIDKQSYICYSDTHRGCLFAVEPQKKQHYGDEHMSFVCVYVANDGFALIGDTRRTLCYADGRVEYYNDTKKIYRIPGRNIFAVLTGGCRFGGMEKKTFDDVLAYVKSYRISEIAREIIQTVTLLGFTQEIEISLWSPDFRGTKCEINRACISLKPDGAVGIDEGRIAPWSFYCQGEDYREIGFMDDEYKTIRTLEDAAAYMSRRMEAVILAEKENADGLKTVGGDCDLYLVRHGNVEHRRWTP